MLHGRTRCRQVLVLTLLAAGLWAGAAHSQISTAYASRGDDIQQADSLARAGDHAQAARLYETGAKRMLFGWDAHVALLSAREYALAGLPDEASRMLDKARRVRGDDLVLAALVRAEIELARNDPHAALATLAALREPLPAALAPDVFLLEARANFASGQTLAGVRAYDARGRVLATTEAREANYRALIAALQAAHAPEAALTGATDDERGWLELSALLQAGAPTPERSAEWRAQHPRHPGDFLLPAPGVAGPATVAPSPSVTTPPASTTGRPTSVALLLPLSGKHRASGIAIRDGFMAAWLADPADLRPQVAVYDTGNDAAGTYARAVAAGARFVVGPLLKEELAAVASAQQIPVPTLALNALSGGQPPAFLYQFALDPVDEARAAARRIALDGYTRGVALFPATAWGKRLSEAFATELAAVNVTLTATQLYDAGARDFSGPLRALLGRFGGAGDRDEDNKLEAASRDPVAEARDGPQFAFVAANATTARALKPQLRFQMVYDLPVYSTSDAWDPSVRADADMDGLMFPEMPWLLYGGQGAVELWNIGADVVEDNGPRTLAALCVRLRRLSPEQCDRSVSRLRGSQRSERRARDARGRHRAARARLGANFRRSGASGRQRPGAAHAE
jgi:outer membrane PBP1 activator LpoA protein